MTITDYIYLMSILFYSILTDTRCFKKLQKETYLEFTEDGCQ